jgi:hypothetical protein
LARDSQRLLAKLSPSVVQRVVGSTYIGPTAQDASQVRLLKIAPLAALLRLKAELQGLSSTQSAYVSAVFVEG